MAINQASFFLFPPRFRPIAEDVARSNSPVVIAASEAEPDLPVVLASQLENWFAERGFRVEGRREQGVKLWQGEEETFLGQSGQVEVSVGLRNQEVNCLYVRFLITKDMPKRLPSWHKLIADLESDFQFCLMDDDNGTLLPSMDFPNLVRRNSNVIELGKAWGFQFE